MIQGVIFDMDGLMFDTERIWGECWAPALAKFGLTEKPGFAADSRGTTGDAQKAVTRRYYGTAVDADALLAELTRLAYARFAAGVPKKPGLDGLLAYLRAQKIPAAVASSSPEEMIRRNLKNAGIESCFQTVVSGEHIARSKPAPDIFLHAAALLEVAPAHTLVLEDSFAGVRAGAAGGFVTVMVPDLMQPDAEIQTLYTACCASLAEVQQRLSAGALG
ncbi:MAG: HAD family phosphatase [Faecalibacterium sp.]|jgi:HAD superfamily hydrolase (TIGR01509 family)|nr:HAD family phosphatase [Faecalibacterium sp.]